MISPTQMQDDVTSFGMVLQIDSTMDTMGPTTTKMRTMGRTTTKTGVDCWDSIASLFVAQEV
jgi:hypothetical protein